MRYNNRQLLAISSLFSDLSKGLFLGAVATRVVSTSLWTMHSLQLVAVGIIFFVANLKLLETKTLRRNNG